MEVKQECQAGRLYRHGSWSAERHHVPDPIEVSRLDRRPVVLVLAAGPELAIRLIPDRRGRQVGRDASGCTFQRTLDDVPRFLGLEVS